MQGPGEYYWTGVEIGGGGGGGEVLMRLFSSSIDSSNGKSFSANQNSPLKINCANRKTAGTFSISLVAEPFGMYAASEYRIQ